MTFFLASTDSRYVHRLNSNNNNSRSKMCFHFDFGNEMNADGGHYNIINFTRHKSVFKTLFYYICYHQFIVVFVCEVHQKKCGFIHSSSCIHLIRSMIWRPDSVSMMSDNSPTPNSNAASSNGFCMVPRPNGPKSPPRFAELQSEYFSANCSKVASPDLI